MIYKKGDIILVPFPFSDELNALKKRPALVLSNELQNRMTDHIICMMITSTSLINELDVAIVNWEECGLMKPSFARPHKIFTIEQKLILKKLGQIQPSDLQNVMNAFLKIVE